MSALYARIALLIAGSLALGAEIYAFALGSRPFAVLAAAAVVACALASLACAVRDPL